MSDTIPFSFVKGVVTGENFVGRKQQLKSLRSNVRSNKSTFIVGLPRMGKTSLVKQCFLQADNQKEWLENDHMAPLYISVDTTRNSKAFWKAIARAIWIFLDKINICYGFLDSYSNLSSADELYDVVMRTLPKAKNETGYSFIFILDEFDGVRLYSDEEDIFHKIRTLNDYGVVVTCSRRTPDYIEKQVKNTKYFTDNGEKIFIGPFDKDEVLDYWEHFGIFFSDFTPTQFSEYKKLVERYVGSHPMLMSWMNNWLFSQKDNPSEVWNPSMSRSQRADTERIMRVAIREVFLRQMDYVKEQELEKTAINLVIGTSHEIPANEIYLLTRYQFIKEVSSEKKKDIFGYNIGPTVGRDVSRRYMCFSALTSHIMKEEYSPEIKGFELLREVELKLRECISEILWDVCDGDDPFKHEMVQINSQEKEKHEIWERILIQSVPQYKRQDFLSDLKEMRKTKNERASYECNPTFDPRGINMVTSTTLGQLWYVFLKWQWREHFEDIFCGWPNKETWRQEVFQPILDWRNAADHHNDEELPDDFVDYASQRAREIIRDITTWMGRRNGR